MGREVNDPVGGEGPPVAQAFYRTLRGAGAKANVVIGRREALRATAHSSSAVSGSGVWARMWGYLRQPTAPE